MVGLMIVLNGWANDSIDTLYILCEFVKSR
jgi:hypothetical protein